MELHPRRVGELTTEDAESPLEGGTWYVTDVTDVGFTYGLEPGVLAEGAWLTMDMLLDGRDAALFLLELQEGEDGPTFKLQFGLLNQCSARVRVPLSAADQSRWNLGREGGWLKPLCHGDRVDPARVDRIRLTVKRKSEEPLRWCQTPLGVTEEEPDRLEEPLLPAGPLLDELGQSAIREWPGKSRSVDEVTDRLQEQYTVAGAHRWPDDFSRWGGWTERTFDATGYFRTHHDGDRWWLVDPEGHPFWSAGMDCVRMHIEAACEGIEGALTWRPEGDEYADACREHHGLNVDYYTANFIRAFGERHHDAWARIALGELRRWGFNTVANWSEWRIAAEAGFPYVRPLSLRFRRTDMVFRDFPDVFTDEFDADVREYAEQLQETADDPAFIGYFLMNEPKWGMASECPAEGMLHNCAECATRRELASWLRERYGSDQRLSEVWTMPVTFGQIESGRWRHGFTPAARRDLETFSEIMVERLFGRLSEACTKIAPNHLNLGARYYTIPPDWALAGMRHFDVFSMNCYNKPVPPAEELAVITDKLGMPAMIGEWHFGALDVGLPASGIGRVRNQAARGKAFRVYQEAAAAEPWCVGAHYFTFADQSALGRFDGENYNIGFVDICNSPYNALVEAARTTHERLYKVATGEASRYDIRPEYLPVLCF